MAEHTPHENDPQQLKDAETLWSSFMQSSKYSVILVAIVLLALLVLFVPFG